MPTILRLLAASNSNYEADPAGSSSGYANMAQLANRQNFQRGIGPY